MATKIYAVKKGLVPGIYNSWEECKAQVDGYSGAEYKSFKNIEQAKEYLGLSTCKIINKLKKESDNSKTQPIKPAINGNSVDIYVDGSFQNNNYSYGYVVVQNNVIIHTASGVGSNKEAAKMQNVAGELSAAMHAICWARENNLTCRIFHDYKGVGSWATGEWKCKNEHTKGYAQFIKHNSATVTDFIHVYGHTGNTFNELADKLAGEAFNS